MSGSIHIEQHVICCETLFYQQWNTCYVCSETLFYWQWKTCYVQWNTVLLTGKYMYVQWNTVLLTVIYILCAVKHCLVYSEIYVMCSETLFSCQWKTCYVQWNTVLSTVKEMVHWRTVHLRTNRQYPQLGISNSQLGIICPIWDWGYMSLVAQSQRTNHQSQIG